MRIQRIAGTSQGAMKPGRETMQMKKERDGQTEYGRRDWHSHCFCCCVAVRRRKSFFF